MMPEELPGEWVEARRAVLDRMVECGWIEAYEVVAGNSSLTMTPLGRQMFGECFKLFHTAGRLNSTEFACFFQIVCLVEFPD